MAGAPELQPAALEALLRRDDRSRPAAARHDAAEPVRAVRRAQRGRYKLITPD